MSSPLQSFPSSRKLPGVRVGNLDDQLSARDEQVINRQQKSRWVWRMFQDVKKSNGAEAVRPRMGQTAKPHRPPGNVPESATCLPPFAETSRPTALTPCVFSTPARESLHRKPTSSTGASEFAMAGNESNVVAKDELPVEFRKSSRHRRVSFPPVTVRVKLSHLSRLGGRVEAHQPAGTALDDMEGPGLGFVQAIPSTK